MNASRGNVLISFAAASIVLGVFYFSQIAQFASTVFDMTNNNPGVGIQFFMAGLVFNQTLFLFLYGVLLLIPGIKMRKNKLKSRASFWWILAFAVYQIYSIFGTGKVFGNTIWIDLALMAISGFYVVNILRKPQTVGV